MKTGPPTKSAENGAESAAPIIFIAPFTPGRVAEHLGASTKIELLICSLTTLGYKIHLVDSAHSPEATFWSSNVYAQPVRLAGNEIYYWRPFKFSNRKIGKLLNIALMSPLASRLATLKPRVIWIYNPYAFEARMALKLAKLCNAPIVLELEDLPHSRSRGINPKPYLDQHFFRLLCEKASLITYVNQSLMQRYGFQSTPKLLLPSVLRRDLTDAQPEVKFRSVRYRLGYFGGLEIEKGADVILDALPLIPEPWDIAVTGTGTLRDRFEFAAKKYPSRLKYLGVVGQQQLISEMVACDAIVNPHRPISEMSDGVFPFKVCEIVATGALLISTRLPSIDLDLSSGVLEFSGSSASLVQAMANAAAFYGDRRDAITQLRNAICNRFGETAIAEKLAAALATLTNRSAETPS